VGASEEQLYVLPHGPPDKIGGDVSPNNK